MFEMFSLPERLVLYKPFFLIYRKKFYITFCIKQGLFI